jgi:hypothetical protein
MDYIITGSWPQKAAAEAGRLFGSEYVNIAADSRKVNDGKFGKDSRRECLEPLSGCCHDLSLLQ